MAKKTELVPFNPNKAPPANVSKMFGGQQNDDLQSGVSGGYPIISIKGKTWSLNENNTITHIMKPDDPEEIASSLEVVIVKANPGLSKVYYEGGYTEGSTEKPVCHSNDGVRPAPDATTAQAEMCATCPHNAWGSRISENGSKGKACADSRRIAICPSGELSRPMLLRVPAASLKELAQYAEMLKRQDAPYQAVVTKLSFDPSVAHPKLMFRAIRWLTEEEATEVLETMNSDVVAQIIGLAGSMVASQAPAMIADLGPRPTPKADKATKPKAAAKPEPAEEEAEEDEEEAPAPKKRGKALAQAKAPAKAAAPKSKLAEKINEASDDLDAALAELDDM